MILEKEREEVSVPAQQPAEAIPYEPAPSGAAPRKMIKCPSKTGINMNKREKRTGEMLTLVIGLAVIRCARSCWTPSVHWQRITMCLWMGATSVLWCCPVRR